jgi:hypothetical protein
MLLTRGGRVRGRSGSWSGGYGCPVEITTDDVTSLRPLKIHTHGRFETSSAPASTSGGLAAQLSVTLRVRCACAATGVQPQCLEAV